MNKNTFCLAPFYSVVVRTDGKISPCCNINGSVNINDVSIDQYWNSNEMQKIRQQMLDGAEYIEVCDACYKEEQLIGKNLRMGYPDNRSKRSTS